MDYTTAAIICVAGMLFFLILGVPIAYSLGFVSIIIGLITFGDTCLQKVGWITFHLLFNLNWTPLPLFTLMACIIAETRIGEDLFRAIDKVAAIMTRQLEHHKGKLYEKGRGNSLARGEVNEAAESARPVRKVVKTKRFAVMPMSVAEAIEQMELLKHNFFLFFDADAGEIKLLYRRNDGDYGLIEPEIG